jgi:hypothetical protein
MSFFTINLENEDGTVVESIQDNGLLSKFIPEVHDNNYCCVKYINLWGNTVFNELQLDDFIKELKIITAKSEDENVKALVNKLIEFATRADNEGPGLIKFIGD